MTDTIKMDCWLTFDQSGINKMYKNKPALYAGEKSMRVVLTVPKLVFKEPDLVASITLTGQPTPEHKEDIVASVKDALDSIPHIHVSIPTAKEHR